MTSTRDVQSSQTDSNKVLLVGWVITPTVQASSRPMCSGFVLGVRDRGPQEESPGPSWDLELTQDSITFVLFLLFTRGDSGGTLSLTAWFTLSYT